MASSKLDSCVFSLTKKSFFLPHIESPPTYSRTQRFLGAVHHTHERPVARGGRVDQAAAEEDHCTHERSQRKRKVLVPSPRHVSTGSTVDTFLTQGELDETYEGIMSLPSIAGSD